MTPNPTLGYRKTLTPAYLSLSHSFPCSLTSEGWRVFKSNCWMGKPEKNFLCLDVEEQTCWRRLSPGWFKNSFKVQNVSKHNKKDRRRGWIYTAEGGGAGAGGRDVERGSAQSSGMKKRKNCCSQENSSLTSASHSNNGGLWFLMLTTSCTTINSTCPHPLTASYHLQHHTWPVISDPELPHFCSLLFELLVDTLISFSTSWV